MKGPVALTPFVGRKDGVAVYAQGRQIFDLCLVPCLFIE